MLRPAGQIILGERRDGKSPCHWLTPACRRPSGQAVIDQSTIYVESGDCCRRIKLLGHPFISGAIRTLCEPSVSRETASSGYHPSSFDIRYPAIVPASQQRLQIDGPSLGAAAGWRSTSHADLTASIKPMARSPPASLERRKHGTSHAHRHPEPLASYLRFHVKPALHSSCDRHSRNTPTACEVRLYEAQDKRFRYLLQSASSSQPRIRTASLQQDRFSPALTFSTLKDYLFSSLPRRRMPASRQ